MASVGKLRVITLNNHLNIFLNCMLKLQDVMGNALGIFIANTGNADVHVAE